MKRSRRCVLPLIAIAGTIGLPAVVSAHTEVDQVAVPAGSEATLKLKPTHGCGDSPTVEVTIRVPVPDAVPHEIDGWTVTAETQTPAVEPAVTAADDLAAIPAGFTVVTFTGGLLAADATGEFPVEFVVPDTPGELLTFPAIQRCENGEELAWIEGDPAGEYPVPRLLVLAADAEAATSIDELDPTTPGIELLTANLDAQPAGSEVPTSLA